MKNSQPAIAAARHYYQSYRQFIRRHPRKVLVGVGIYCFIAFAWMIGANISITPDDVVVILFIPALMLGEGWVFIREWAPFLLLILAYEELRSFADLGVFVHVHDVIAVERWLWHGAVPTIWLQHHLDHPGVHWYDLLATLAYFLHFALPLVMAFYLWLNNKRQYWQFVGSFVLLCFAGFLTYIIFPAAPPWLAAKEGALPHVDKIIDKVLALFPNGMTISYFYHSLNPNQVAAMPSLHAAFPWLVFLMLWQITGKKALWFLPYCLWLWFSIVYLGEHYVIDAVAGVAYASGAFVVGKRLMVWLETHRFQLRLGRTQLAPAITMVGSATEEPVQAEAPA